MSSLSFNQASLGRYLGIAASGYAGTFNITIQSDGIFVFQNGIIIKSLTWN